MLGLAKEVQRQMKMFRKLGESAPATCDECGVDSKKQRLQRCGKCRVAWYCSSSFQKAAWGKHKESCFEGVKKERSERSE
jgi:predicted Zn-ribbon and HTH transcriptional regulator